MVRLSKTQILNLPDWLQVPDMPDFEVKCVTGTIRHIEGKKVKYVTANGYPCVIGEKFKSVHRLVAEAAFGYYGYDINGKLVVHIDRQKCNTKIENLVVCTRSELDVCAFNDFGLCVPVDIPVNYVPDNKRVQPHESEKRAEKEAQKDYGAYFKNNGLLEKYMPNGYGEIKLKRGWHRRLQTYVTQRLVDELKYKGELNLFNLNTLLVKNGLKQITAETYRQKYKPKVAKAPKAKTPKQPKTKKYDLVERYYSPDISAYRCFHIMIEAGEKISKRTVQNYYADISKKISENLENQGNSCIFAVVNS